MGTGISQIQTLLKRVRTSFQDDGLTETITRGIRFFGYLFVKVGTSISHFTRIKITLRKSQFNIGTYESLFAPSVLQSRPFYNVGASSFYHPYWTNIDFVTTWYKQDMRTVLHHDLMSGSPLPIETGTAEIIYTSHTIEHIKEESVQRFFTEAFRALKTGGIFRITTGPDAETDFRALMNSDENWFYWDKYYELPGRFEHIFRESATSVSLSERWLHHFASQLAPNDISPSTVKFGELEIQKFISEYGFPGVLDHLCAYTSFDPNRPGNHISWWTHEKIFNYLRNAGFTNIHRSGYQQSVSPLMRNSALFDSTHPQMSIYVEAIKG